jgi:hypothetical protein
MHRDLIKIQYHELIPALKGGKSGLSHTDFLDEMMKYMEMVQSGNQAVGTALQRQSESRQRHMSFPFFRALPSAPMASGGFGGRSLTDNRARQGSDGEEKEQGNIVDRFGNLRM